MPAAKYAKLNDDVLGRYYHLNRQIADMTQERKEIHARILQALKANRKVEKGCGFEAQLNVSERAAIPWQEEANRWKEIALEFGRQLGKSKKALKGFEIEYPKVPVERLLVKPKGQEDPSDES